MLGPRGFVRAIGVSLLALAASSIFSSRDAAAAVWYVSASAAAYGNGSRFRPFNSLSAVQSASKPYDQIIVLPSPSSTPPLDGGITLKTGQSLIGAGRSSVLARNNDAAPRITNSSASQNGGNAVVLANGTAVANLVVQNSWTNGLLGTDVSGVQVLGNQITGTNQSCTVGFTIFGFSVVVGTTTIDIPGLPGGWAAIEFDFATIAGAGKVIAANNYIHDSTCGDGIDIQLTGSTNVTATVTGNVFEDLQQGPLFSTVEAIGTQTSDTSTLTLNAAYNFEDNLGNGHLGDGALANGADAEGFLINLGGYSAQNVNVDHHTYRDSDSLGDSSANGFEVAIMQDGGPTANVLINNSSFSGSPSDIVQFNFLGSNATINASVNNSIIENSTGVGFTPVLEVGNNGTCLEFYNGGPNSQLSVQVNNSRLTNCVAQGIGIFNQYAAPSIKLDVERSLIEGNTYSNIIFQNSAALDDLEVKVENSILSGSQGRQIEFDDPSSLTVSSKIDFGGGALGSVGNNTIAGDTEEAVLTDYDVYAEHDWWGSASGPASGLIDLVGTAKLYFEPFLMHPPF